MASKLRAAVRALLNSAGDAGSDLQKILWGTPSGARVLYPADNKTVAKPETRGQALSTGGTFDFFLTQMAAFFDMQSISWATVQTNATGVAPVILDSHGFYTEAAPAKDEVANTLEIAFEEDYANAYYAAFGLLASTQSVIHIHTKTVALIEFEYHELPSGLGVNINSQVATIVTLGHR